MGMIPIVLAIAGFVFLWSIVNYNSLSARRSTILSLQAARDQLINKYVYLTKQIAALLKIYGITPPAYLVNLANDPAQKIENIQLNRALEQIKLLSRNEQELQNNPDYSDLLQQLESNASLLIKNQQQLMSAIREYNGQATQMPYRIIAQLFGFKKINSPVV